MVVDHLPNSIKHKMAFHSLVYLLARLIQAATTLAMLAAYTRLLTPSEYGEYSAVNAGVMLAYGTLFNWLATSIFRIAPASENRANTYSCILVVYLTVVSAVAIAASLSWAALDRSIDLSILLLGVALFAAIGWLELNYSLLASQFEAGKYSTIALLRAFLVAVFGIALAYLGYGTRGVLAGAVLGMITPGLYLVATEWFAFVKQGPDWRYLRELLAYGLPLALSLALHAAAVNCDKLLLRVLADSHALGLYTPRFELADRVLLGFMGAIAIAALPRAARELDTNGRAAADEQLSQNFVLTVGLGLPLVVGICATASTLSTVLFGSRFQGVSGWLIAIIAISSFVNAIRSFYFDHAFQLAKRSSSLIIVMLALATAAILFNLVLIPHYGIWGAAISMLSAHIVGLIVCILLGRRFYELPLPLADLTKISIASITMGSIVYLAPYPEGLLGLLQRCLSGCFIYFVLLAVLGLVDRKRLLAFYRRKGKSS